MVGLFRTTCLVVMIVGNLGDTISTYLCAKRYGTQSERNPIVRGLMNTIGIVPSMIMKFVLHILLAYWIYTTQYWWVNLIIGVPYVLVSYNNFKQAYKKEKQ